jgi:hypothetical protein
MKQKKNINLYKNESAFLFKLSNVNLILHNKKRKLIFNKLSKLNIDDYAISKCQVFLR